MRFVSFFLALLTLCGCDSASSSAAARFAAQSQPLDAFLSDRPAAVALLQRHPQLEQWLRARLREPIGPYRLAWENTPPPGEAPAAHRRYPGQPFIVICISGGLPPADQLTALLYETLNAQNRPHFQQLEEQVARERISREAFIDGVLAREHAALLRTKALLPELLPLAPDEQASLHLYTAFMETPVSFAEFEAWRRRHAAGFDARAHYDGLYDRIIAKARNRNG